ncbi:DUF6272 family protein [Leptodesmis sichuanensis]|uniref:DUF6272 family protein n=1 Tax=Leptodesmis sichuanensis TaxID=2906798 RepID=UPI001F1A19A0|nr:DUF6272 family protein [Leptodesmis sichuanensis]UIE37273.1 ATP-binding protein [Leptodesmis sichuanensis A121]
MNQVFGDFSEDLPVSQEGLTIAFSPISLPLKQRWQTNGLSADFMADYFAVFFPGNNSSVTESDTAEVKSAVSFIANELIENAMKFNDERSPYPISISLRMHSDRLVFQATNSVNPNMLDSFHNYIDQLTTLDPNELYIQLMEADESGGMVSSGLGLLTMMTDYLAKLGWKFETINTDPRIILVTTMVQLMI